MAIVFIVAFFLLFMVCETGISYWLNSVNKKEKKENQPDNQEKYDKPNKKVGS